MELSFHHFSDKNLSVFKETGEMVMVFNEPVTRAYLTATNLQRWMTTLEKAIDEEPNLMQALGLRSILHFFQYNYQEIINSHEEILKKSEKDEQVTESPTSEDFQEYLMHYSRVIANAPSDEPVSV